MNDNRTLAAILRDYDKRLVDWWRARGYTGPVEATKAKKPEEPKQEPKAPPNAQKR